MAAGAATATTIAEYLMSVWPEKRLLIETYKDSPLLGLIKKERRGGRDWRIPVRYTGQQGRSATFATALANQSSSEQVEFILTMAEDYGLGKVTGEAVDLSDDNVNALADAIDSEMESTTEALKRSLCVGIYGNGGGSLGRRSSLSTNTITLTNAGDCVNFEVGMVLKASSADGTSGAVRAGSATVTNVNPSGGTVTVDSAAGITGFADNDYLFVEGDFGLKIKGLGAWIPTSAPSSTAFFGVDRTVHIQRLAGHRYDGSGAPVRETIRKALVECARFSGFPDSVFLNPTEHFKLCEELEGKVVYERSSNPSTPDVGFDGAVILSPSGSKVKVYSDPSCPTGYGWALRLKDWRFYHASKGVPTILNRDGLTVQRSASADAYEWRMGYRGQMACINPAHQCALTFLEETAMPIADGNLYPARSYQREAVHFSFRFKPNGSSAVSASSQVGCKGVTVTRTGAGVFQINLGKKYPKLVSAQFTLFRSAAAPGHCFQVTSNTVATDGKLSVTYVENNAGTFGAADLIAHADTHVACDIVVANTGLDS